jgi:hypothetical protein
MILCQIGVRSFQLHCKCRNTKGLTPSFLIDERRKVSRARAVVDGHHHYPWGARMKHGHQSRQSLKKTP